MLLVMLEVVVEVVDVVGAETGNELSEVSAGSSTFARDYIYLVVLLDLLLGVEVVTVVGG